MRSARTKALDITPKVKKAVWERDQHRCIICGSPMAMPNAHYIPRSQGGLGIEENVVTLCNGCHYEADHTTNRSGILGKIREYLMSIYPDWDESKLVYRKYEVSE